MREATRGHGVESVRRQEDPGDGEPCISDNPVGEAVFRLEVEQKAFIEENVLDGDETMIMKPKIEAVTRDPLTPKPYRRDMSVLASPDL